MTCSSACGPPRWRQRSWPFRSATWVAAMAVVVDRDGGDLERTRRLGAARFERAVRREVVRRGGQRPCLRIVRKVFAALSDPAGVLAHRPAAFERIAWVISDWDHAKTGLVDTEARMTAVLDELELTELATSIDGLSAVGAAAILAETGDLTRFTSARAVVKHAGLAPRESASPAPSPAVPASPEPAGHCCAPPPGERCGAACKPTGCTPPATGT